MTAEVYAPFETREFERQQTRATARSVRTAEEQRVDPLTGGWVTVVVVVGMMAGLIALGGMTLSFRSVRTEMIPSFGVQWAWLVPIVVDLAVLVFSGVDLVLARLDMSHPLARLMVYLATAGTVYLNANATGDLPGRVAHVLMPSIWVVFIELMRHVVRRQTNLSTGSHREPIPTARWFLSPLPTMRLWRRMVLWRTNSYGDALVMERARLGSIAVARQVLGRAWRWRISPLLRLQMTLGELNPYELHMALNNPTGALTFALTAGIDLPEIADSLVPAAVPAMPAAPVALVPVVAEPSGGGAPLVPVETAASTGNAGSTSTQTPGSARPEAPAKPEEPVDPEQAKLTELLKAAGAVALTRGARSASRIAAELDISFTLAKHLSTVLSANDEIAKLQSGARTARSHEVLLGEARTEFAGQETPTAEAIRRAIGCRASTARKLRDDLADLAEDNRGLVPDVAADSTEDEDETRPADSTEPQDEIDPAATLALVPMEDAEPTDAEDDPTDLAA